MQIELKPRPPFMKKGGEFVTDEHGEKISMFPGELAIYWGRTVLGYYSKQHKAVAFSVGIESQLMPVIDRQIRAAVEVKKLAWAPPLVEPEPLEDDQAAKDDLLMAVAANVLGEKLYGTGDETTDSESSETPVQDSTEVRSEAENPESP